MFENENHKIEIIDGIMYYTCKCKIFSKEIVLEGIKERLAMSNNEDQYIVCDMLSVGYWPASGRNEFGKKEHQACVKVSGVILKSNLIITLLNWLLIFFHIDIPVKIFSNKEEALAWVLKQKEEDENRENQQIEDITKTSYLS